MSDQPVLTERRDGVLLITLNRPEARNAVNLPLAEGVAAALDDLDGSGDVSVGIGRFSVIEPPRPRTHMEADRDPTNVRRRERAIGGLGLRITF